MARYYYKKKKKKFVPKDLASLKELKIKTALMESIPEDITQLYPEARNIKRHFILHIGETNTGKPMMHLRILQCRCRNVPCTFKAACVRDSGDEPCQRN